MTQDKLRWWKIVLFAVPLLVTIILAVYVSAAILYTSTLTSQYSISSANYQITVRLIGSGGGGTIIDPTSTIYWNNAIALTAGHTYDSQFLFSGLIYATLCMQVINTGANTVTLSVSSNLPASQGTISWSDYTGVNAISGNSVNSPLAPGGSTGTIILHLNLASTAQPTTGIATFHIYVNANG